MINRPPIRTRYETDEEYEQALDAYEEMEALAIDRAVEQYYEENHHAGG